MAPPPPARDSSQAVEARANHLPPTACPGNDGTPGAAGGRQRPPLVEERGPGDPQRVAQPLLLRAGCPPARRVTSTFRTAGCGPACPVVWEGNGGANPAVPYPDSG